MSHCLFWRPTGFRNPPPLHVLCLQCIGQRAMILSGMNAAEVGEIIGAYRHAGKTPHAAHRGVKSCHDALQCYLYTYTQKGKLVHRCCFSQPTALHGQSGGGCELRQCTHHTLSDMCFNDALCIVSLAALSFRIPLVSVFTRQVYTYIACEWPCNYLIIA